MGVWLTAAGIALFQVVGSFGAADDQPERKAIDAVAVLLVLAGPAALARRDRWPLAAVAVSAAATDVYLGLGYPYGPVFVSVAVALFHAVQPPSTPPSPAPGTWGCSRPSAATTRPGSPACSPPSAWPTGPTTATGATPWG